jgi:hypothetical protein
MYSQFVKKAKLQDARNEFGTLTGVETYDIPVTLYEFYKQANPIDVEITQKDLTSIKFYSGDLLRDVQNEFDLPDGTFVFASREGDPLLLRDDEVYTAVHGKSKWILKKIADSFDEFIDNII